MTKPIIEVHLRHELHALVRKEIADNGPACDLNHLDVSDVMDISDTFKGTGFVGDVSRWSIGTARDLRGLFANTPFSGDLSKWDLNPRCHNDGMLPPTFLGTLPLLPTEPPNERTAAYIAMFDGVDKYDHYLAQKPFGKLHAAFIVDTTEKPSWLNQEQLEQMHNIRDLGLGLGLQHEALCTLMEGEYYNPGKGIAPESVSIDFGQ